MLMMGNFCVSLIDRVNDTRPGPFRWCLMVSRVGKYMNIYNDIRQSLAPNSQFSSVVRRLTMVFVRGIKFQEESSLSSVVADDGGHWMDRNKLWENFSD